MKRIPNLPRAALTFVLSPLFAACLLSGCGGSRGAAHNGGATSAEHPLLGAMAPEFQLEVLSGSTKVASLAGAGAKIRVLDFWATWCEPCRHSFPAYQELSQRYQGKVSVIGISEDDESEGIADFARQTG